MMVDLSDGVGAMICFAYANGAAVGVMTVECDGGVPKGFGGGDWFKKRM